MPTSGKIIIADYSEEWPVLFNRLKNIYANTLGELVTGIEHVGSTSVKGLKAKPVIDIDIIIKDKDKLPPVIKILETLGYTHCGDLGINGREAFKCNSETVPLDGSNTIWPKHHLYVCLDGCDSLKNHLQFRNHLRAYPEQAQAYGNP